MKIQPAYSTNTGVPGGVAGASPEPGGVDHLRAADPVLAGLIDEVGGPLPGPDASRPAPDDHYGALVRAIVGQQLSVSPRARSRRG